MITAIRKTVDVFEKKVELIKSDVIGLVQLPKGRWHDNSFLQYYWVR
jgi:hypothetical protein